MRSDGVVWMGVVDDGGGDGDVVSVGVSVGDGEGVDGGDDFGVVDADEIVEAGDIRVGFIGWWWWIVVVVVWVIVVVDVGNDVIVVVCVGRGRGGGVDV